MGACEREKSKILLALKRMAENKRSWRWEWEWASLLGFLAMSVILLFLIYASSETKTPLIRRFLRARIGDSLWIDVKEEEVMMSNGVVDVIMSNPAGDVTGISYNGVGNLLEIVNQENNRGYWDLVWNKKGVEILTNNIDKLNGTKCEIIKSDENQIEISFKRTWNVSMKDEIVPLNIDKRYILLRGYSGFYTYCKLERLDGWPAVEMDQIRIVYRLRNDKFKYMAVTDDRQRIMPSAEDRATGQPLAYPEAVLLTNASNPKLRGEVDDKYQYSIENQYNKVHGWISSDPPIGVWMITASNEFRNAGPVHQDLTSHVGPIMLSSLVSTHYAGVETAMQFQEGEPWQMVYGPMAVYLNSVQKVKDHREMLWKNAKQQMQEEIGKWPYSFPQSQDFPCAAERGTVVGKLQVRDWYIKKSTISAVSAYVGLAAPGELGSWQRESKHYQFWTRTNKKGYFSINNIRPGNYNLYGWVNGYIGDYKYNETITIQPGCKIKLNNLVFEPPRFGPTLWEIGIPDRSSAEFYIPNPYPTLMNPVLINNHQNKMRQYGIWDRYAELHPREDLIYVVGVSKYAKDWFYAHVTRSIGNSTYIPTTWQIIFSLENLKSGNYTLQLALASSADSNLTACFNDRTPKEPHFSVGTIGGDNAIARHGLHGLYWLFSINVPSNLLHEGNNTIYLTQTKRVNYFQGVMYDYIRLEGPPVNK